MWRNVLMGVLIGTFIVTIALGTFVCIQIYNMKPDYSGNFEVKGLKEPVSVFWDSSGVIHINGRNMEDVILATGFVSAKERLWQMEIMRRVAKSRLSEIYGDETLEIDKLFSTLSLDSLTEDIYQDISDISKVWLEKYSQGINLYIDEIGDDLPIEFILMKTKPEKWQPQDCLLQNRLIAWSLNFNWKADLLYWQLRSKLPKNKFQEIWPRWREYPKIISVSNLPSFIKKNLEIQDQLKRYIGFGNTHFGSNNWVIAPSKSQNGFALLANDPHLNLQLPSIWLEIHLKTPVLDVAGFSLIGSPGIIIGRNSNCAWGVTHGMIDDCDYFIEKIDTVKKIYWQKDQQNPLGVRRRVISVKNKPDVLHKSFYTANGPVFNFIFPEIKMSQFISLKWVGWERSDELFTFIQFIESENWKDFTEALRSYSLPANNFVYADISGNIGYRLGGKIPIRTYETGLLPQEGFRQNKRWNSWIPFDEMPSIYNPEKGWIVTANNRIVDDYPYYLSELWEPPYRAMRITELIDTGGKIDFQKMHDIQMDRLNLLAKEILPLILSDLEMLPIQDDKKEVGLLLLKNWDYSMEVAEIAPTLYEVLQILLIKNIFSDEMGDDLFHIFTDLPNYYLRIFSQLFNKRNSPWFNDVLTPSLETRKDIILKSYNETFQYLEKNLGKEMAEWQWGKLNHLELKMAHNIGRVSLMRRIFNKGPFPFSGCNTTVNVGISKYSQPFWIEGGASLRFLVDWEKDRKYWSILPGGNSGQFLSEFYGNQIDDWLVGSLKQVNFDGVRSRHKLLLKPEKK